MAVVFEYFQALGLRCLYFYWTLTIVEAFRVSKYWVMLASNSDILVNLSFHFFVWPSAFMYALQPESGLVTLFVSQSCIGATHAWGVEMFISSLPKSWKMQRQCMCSYLGVGVQDPPCTPYFCTIVNVTGGKFWVISRQTNSDVWQSGFPLYGAAVSVKPRECLVVYPRLSGDPVVCACPVCTFQLLNHVTYRHLTCLGLHTPRLCFNIVSR